MADHIANVGSHSINEKKVVAGGVPPVMRSWPVKSGQGTLAGGLLVARTMAGEVIPYDSDTVETIGAGDGADKTFSAVLGPLKPGSVAVTDGVETFTDDGCGVLTGSANGTGRVNYSSGMVNVAFNAAPANEAAVTATVRHALEAVLAQDVDTTKEAAALVCAKGQVARKYLLVGALAADAAACLALERAGIYPI